MENEHENTPLQEESLARRFLKWFTRVASFTSVVIQMLFVFLLCLTMFPMEFAWMPSEKNPGNSINSVLLVAIPVTIFVGLELCGYFPSPSSGSTRARISETSPTPVDWKEEFHNYLSLLREHGKDLLVFILGSIVAFLFMRLSLYFFPSNRNLAETIFILCMAYPLYYTAHLYLECFGRRKREQEPEDRLESDSSPSVQASVEEDNPTNIET